MRGKKRSAQKEPAVVKSAPSGLSSLIAGMHDYRPIEWIRTGIAAIDLVVGQGLPRGRFIEVLGDPATAKSAFVYATIGAFQRSGGQCILLDTEGKTDRVFAEKLGVEWDKLGYPKVQDMNECTRILAKVAKMADPSVPTLVCWDSLAATRGVDELEDAASKDGLGNEPGQRAKAFSAVFRAVLGELTHKGVTLLATNQVRVNFNFRSGYTTLESTGGKAIKFHAAVRLMMKPRGRIRSKDRDLVTGMVVECECIKNTMAAPFKKASIHFKFDTGFARYSGLDELLLRHGRLVQKAGWLCFKDKHFRGADLERVASEMPDLLDPIVGVIETPAVTVEPTSAAPEEPVTVAEGDDE